jgi:hypothetical protein
MATDDPEAQGSVTDVAVAKAAAARRAFFEYGMAFFVAGALVGALAVQLIHMAIG